MMSRLNFRPFVHTESIKHTFRNERLVEISLRDSSLVEPALAARICQGKG